MGAPTKFDPKFIEQARLIAKLGATDFEIAEILGVTDRTLRTWKAKHPEFAAALQAGKDEADDRVERALYHRAVGYDFATEKVMQHDGQVIRADTVTHLPPDVSAAQYWLNNRRGYAWKSKTETTHAGKVGLEQIIAGSDE